MALLLEDRLGWARKLGVNNAAVHHWCNGEAPVPHHRVEQILSIAAGD